jgi:hypothetical protein
MIKDAEKIFASARLQRALALRYLFKLPLVTGT